MVDPLSYIVFQLVLHNWCNKGRVMCYPVMCYSVAHVVAAAGLLSIRVVLFHISDAI